MCKEIISIKEVKDSGLEKQLVEEGIYTFAILDRSMSKRPLSYVSTKRSDIGLESLPGWTLIKRSDELQRFSVKLSQADIFQQLVRFYPGQKMHWDEA